MPGLFEVADGFGALARDVGRDREAAFPDFGPEECVLEVRGRGAGCVLDCEVLAAVVPLFHVIASRPFFGFV